MKIILTENGKKRLTEINAESKVLRLKLTYSTCCEQGLGIVLDKINEDDEVIQVEEFKFVIEKSLAELFESATIDYVEDVFKKSFEVMVTMNAN